MSVAHAKGPRGKADRLFSQLIRSRGVCEGCGETRNLQTAHILSRRYAAVRTFEGNAFCACAGCHRHWTEWPIDFRDFVWSKIGEDGYLALVRKASTFTKVDWPAEVVRLQQRLQEVG